MALTDTEAQKRGKAFDDANGALANLEAAQRRVQETKAKHAKVMNDAKADIGTAESQLTKAQESYSAARRKLVGMLPNEMRPAATGTLIEAGQ